MVFGWSSVLGSTDFWTLPRGLSGSGLDIRTGLSGYWWSTTEPWRWPLLAVSKPNWPDGTNAELFDIVPIVAIVGKLVRTLFGATILPYPIWVTCCFGLNSVALAVLVRTLGARDLVATLVAGVFAALAPLVQSRFGHLALMANWLPIFMLALYFSKVARPTRTAVAIGLCILAPLVQLYLYAMTAAIAAAICLREVPRRPASIFSAVLGLTGVVVAGLLPVWAMGILSGGPLADFTGDYRRYSMNVVAPFWPQTSGLFQWTGNYWLTRGSIGATPGQYEGFCYLGGGGLLLLTIAVLSTWRSARCWCSDHLVLLVILVVLTIWALSDRIYAGPFLVLSYEAPGFLTRTVLGWFRSCGRFFWPVAWLLLAWGIAATFAHRRRDVAVGLAIVAVVLQWVDTSPWRGRLAALVSDPASASVFHNKEVAGQVEQAMRGAGAVAAVPAFGCSSDADNFESPLNEGALEIQLMAARANASMAVVYLARGKRDCRRALDPVPGGMVVLLDDPATWDFRPDGGRSLRGRVNVCSWAKH